jgi:hypothetical protein
VRGCLVRVIAKLLADTFAGFGIPDLNVTVNRVVAAGRDPLAIGLPVDRVDIKSVVNELLDLLTRFQIPDCC